MKTRRIPEWLSELSPGKYSLNKLVDISHKQKNSLCRTLKNLNLRTTYSILKDSPYPQAFYYWPGLERFLKKNTSKN